MTKQYTGVYAPRAEFHDGVRSDYEWNRLRVTDWVRGFLKLQRKRTYEDAENTKLVREGWILGVQIGRRHRVLLKYERDLAS